MSTSKQNESEEKERVSYTRFGLSDGGRRLLWGLDGGGGVLQ
jgi:hypothetical protein